MFVIYKEKKNIYFLQLPNLRAIFYYKWLYEVIVYLSLIFNFIDLLLFIIIFFFFYWNILYQILIFLLFIFIFVSEKNKKTFLIKKYYFLLIFYIYIPKNSFSIK
jgi:hypothetical protein